MSASQNGLSGRESTSTDATVAAAGHPPALISRASGPTAELSTQGTLLGVFPDARIEETTTLLGEGDSLALYTDGLSEAHAPARMLDPDEMLAALSRMPPESAQETITTLVGLLDLSQGARDDIAILAVKVGAVQARGVRAA